MPGADTTHALALAERMRAAVESRRIDVPGNDLVNHITISAGVASTILATPADMHRLIRDADKALYRAKSDGRNCVRQ